MGKIEDLYQVVRGTAYPIDLPPQAIDVLSAAMADNERRRVRVRYGRDYHSEVGYVTRTTGPKLKCVALLPRSNSLGCDPLGHGVTSIETTRAPIRVLWSRPNAGI